jgi:decaprenylphospho-beta-D-erythro-pentofuranosid-2-ulose 2-reductase
MEIRSSQEAAVVLNGFKSPGRVALVGANSEIGLAIVAQLPADQPREVILVGRTGEYALDVTDKAARTRVISELFDKADVDIAIIAVGLLGNDPEKSDCENLLAAIDVNYVSTLHLLELISERMKIQAHGTILVISSFAQVRPRADNFGYGSTKAGLDFYARGLALKLEGTGVKIKILRPGFVKSKMTQGMSATPFNITSDECGKYGVQALASEKLVTWAPAILKYVATVFALLPAPIFRKISQR